MKLTRAEMELEMEYHRLVFGWCMKRHRLARHLKQTELADLCHFSRGEVQHMEHGRHGTRDPTRLCLCLGLGFSECELVAEIDRVKMEWAIHGLPADVEMPKSLAVKMQAFCDEFKTNKTPPPCPSAMTPALLYAWMRATDSTKGR